ncbi:hypothetical protein GCM10007977_043060 [Dactylosporangium sucinum]|uniref:Uncharacterized protein n=1 Tax=Dactylosporangium sucinum TaxID=1424081 RepID=A0A917TT34_9ACTN|nr:hypothetical protein GCM10007977_043060 [Dactylosporangium sucinum]
MANPTMHARRFQRPCGRSSRPNRRAVSGTARTDTFGPPNLCSTVLRGRVLAAFGARPEAMPDRNHTAGTSERRVQGGLPWPPEADLRV